MLSITTEQVAPVAPSADVAAAPSIPGIPLGQVHHDHVRLRGRGQIEDGLAVSRLTHHEQIRLQGQHDTLRALCPQSLSHGPLRVITRSGHQKPDHPHLPLARRERRASVHLRRTAQRERVRGRSASAYERILTIRLSEEPHPVHRRTR